MTEYGYMWDSASNAQPANSKLNAYYVNGRYAHRPITYGRGKLWIDVFGTAPNAASILQIDGLTQAEIEGMIGKIPRWLDERAHYGLGMLYCNHANLAAVQRAAGNRQYNVWFSTLDGTVPLKLPSPGGHLVAVQAWNANMTGINADKSAVIDLAFWEAHAA